jgi:predicted ATP-grasp superfamily ATP-dependent carboligase
MTTVFVYEDVTARWAGSDEKSRPAPSLLAEGRAMLDAVTADFRAIPNVTLVRYAAHADFTLLIAPESAGRLEHLATEVLHVGDRLLGPSPDAIRLTADKLALAKHWQQCNVQTPETWPLGEEPDDQLLVIKPRDGAGSQAMSLVSGRASRRKPDVSQLIAQQNIPGFAASVSFLIGPGSIIPLVPCQQLLSADGRFRYLGGRLPIRRDLAERAAGIANQAVQCVPGLLGYVGVDVVLGDDGRDWAIEINPRITTSYVGLRRLAKFNLAEAMLAAVEERPLPPMNWSDQEIEFRPDGS